MTMKRCRDDGGIEAMAMANCLMLLSKVGKTDPSSKHDDIEHHQHSRVFACKTCDKRFSSFQALGGHRASHKKPRLASVDLPDSPASPKKPKTHECSICGLEFAIGQALGGHMRRHRAALNEGMVAQRDLLSEMEKSSGGGADGGGLCLDLKLGPCGTDLDLKVAPPRMPVVHLFI